MNAKTPRRQAGAEDHPLDPALLGVPDLASRRLGVHSFRQDIEADKSIAPA
jgi:hypothetical protein